MSLIAVSGKAGAGKSTVAKHLTERYGYIEYEMATPLKRMLQAYFGFTDEQVFGNQATKTTSDPRWFDVTPRTVMQFVGTDLFRKQLGTIMPSLGQSCHIHAFKLWYQELLGSNPNTRKSVV